MLVESQPSRNTLPWDVAFWSFLAGIITSFVVLVFMVWG